MTFASGNALTRRRLALILGETALLTLVCGAVTSFRDVLDFVATPDDGARMSIEWPRYLWRGLALTLLCQACFILQDLYDWRVTRNSNQTAVKLLESIFYAAVLMWAVHFAIDAGTSIIPPDMVAPYVNRPWTSLAALFAVLPFAHFYRLLFHWIFSAWQLHDRVLLVGSGSTARTLVDEIKRLKDPAYEVVGFVRCDVEPVLDFDVPCLGTADRLGTIAADVRADRVVVALDERRGKLPVIELLNCRLSGVRVEEAELLYERLTGKIAVQRLRPSYLVFSEGFTQGRITFTAKRGLDVLLAGFGLLLAAPIAALTALAIKIESSGPVFYGQTRVGKDGRVFTVYKFRSMRTDAEKGGPQWAAKNDRRVTRIGTILRKTRIDEIPQMWNVLRNEMSFVGPRPERPFFVEELRKQIPYYMERLIVKPGLTGWAQINYQYGSSVEDALTKLQYDLWYIKNLSIFVDLLIVLRTIKVIVLRRGAN
ncbi:MAG: TIGR03013 family PEP-CTERM/XrtA system glycosyltransferase [Planctomycetes bacterium]|nr:TIGR03013 family PEP-CTERM/XrtA system glycosyltransferase [Planctomycetota bacterium]